MIVMADPHPGPGRGEGLRSGRRDRWFRARLLLIAGWLLILGLTYRSFDLAAPWYAARPVVILVLLAVGFLALGPLLIGRGRGIRHLLAAVILFGAFAAGIADQYRAETSPEKGFVRVLLAIRPGMTPREVEAVAHARLRSSFASKGQVLDGVMYELSPRVGRDNSAVIYILFKNGRVVAVLDFGNIRMRL